MATAVETEKMSTKVMVIAPVGRTIGVPRPIRPMIDQNTGEPMGDYWEEEVVLLEGGTLLDQTEIAPRILKALDANEPHAVLHFKRLTETQAQQAAIGNFTITSASPDQNPFLATTGDDNPLTVQHTVATRIRNIGE